MVPPMMLLSTSLAARPNVRPPTPPTPRIDPGGTPNNNPARSTVMMPTRMVHSRVSTVCREASAMPTRFSSMRGNQREMPMMVTVPAHSVYMPRSNAYPKYPPSNTPTDGNMREMLSWR